MVKIGKNPICINDFKLSIKIHKIYYVKYIYKKKSKLPFCE